jgi:hypothetical protein
MNSNLATMTTTELRKYVVAHPDDMEAFHLWTHRVTENPPKQIFPAPKGIEDVAEVERLIRAHLEERAGKKAS